MKLPSNSFIKEDRFIFQRPMKGYNSQFNILDEVFITPQKNSTNYKEMNDENMEIKYYQALLQNQILGIRDSFTINDYVGNSEVFKGYPYIRNINLLRQKDTIFENKENNCEEGSFIIGFSESSMVPPLKIDRSLPKSPFKVLDAPALQDDFYLNLLDWSSQDILAVGLGPCVYLWSSSNGEVTKLNDIGPRDSVTSICWSNKGNFLAVGTYDGQIQIWDYIKNKEVRTMKGHFNRVGSMAWNSKLLSTGSRDKSILNRDIRTKEDWISKLVGHKQEVCGLKWSFDEQQLGSGGNDNKLLIWNINNISLPSAKFCGHTAAIKAIAWNPHQHGLLASGGGTADRSIRFWDTLTNTMIQSIETDSQVCNLIFSKSLNEFVSTHGYSKNAICLWKYPSLRKIATLTGHSLRVLYLSMNKDGSIIVTGAGDETLRFWNLFPPIENKIDENSIFNSDFR